MKKLALAFCAAVLFAPPASAMSLKDFIVQLRKKWDAPTEPFRVVDNVYYVGTEGLAAYYGVSTRTISRWVAKADC